MLQFLTRITRNVRPGQLEVGILAITAGVSRVASGPLCLHAIATTPVGPTGSFARSLPLTSAFPDVAMGQLLH